MYSVTFLFCTIALTNGSLEPAILMDSLIGKTQIFYPTLEIVIANVDVGLPHYAGSRAIMYEYYAYFIGGSKTPGVGTTDVFIFNPQSIQTTEGTPMNIARSDHCVTVAHNSIIVCGGESTNTGVTCERYQKSSNKWTMMKKFPAPMLLGATMATLGGNVFVFGGYINETVTDICGGDTVFMYDSDRDVWEPKKPMPRCLSYHAMIGQDSLALICGGTTNAGFVTLILQMFSNKL
jgi:hypothetical protein